LRISLISISIGDTSVLKMARGGAAEQLAEKLMFDAQPLKGRLISKHFSVSLKRYPDTKPEIET
jgi:hypothetical protein